MFSKFIITFLKILKSFDRSYSIQNKSQKQADGIQKNLLNQLIKKSIKTDFGIDHNFKKIKTYDDFKTNVPVRDYEEIKIYVNKIKKGKKVY